MNKHLKSFYRLKRLLWPSPAEKEFIKCMGWWFFMRYDVRREHRAQGYMIDFAIPAQRVAIEVDGRNFHGRQDIVRDAALRRAGWYIYRIEAAELWLEPKIVRKYVKRFVRNPKAYVKRYN